MLEKFSMIECKDVTLHPVKHFKLSSEQSLKTNEEFEKMSKIPYVNTVGFIINLMVCIVAYLAHGISILSKFMTYRSGNTLDCNKLDTKIFKNVHLG